MTDFIKDKQQFTLLTLNAGFQQDVVFFREKWKVDARTGETNESYQAWQKRFIQESDRYTQSDDYQKELTQASQELNIVDRQSLYDKLTATIPLNAFHADIDNLVKKYALPQKFSDYLKSYLTLGTIHGIPFPLGNVTIQTSHDIKHGKDSLALIIGPDTTLDDVVNAWPSIELHQSHLPGYRPNVKRVKKLPNLERDTQIFELSRQGKTHEEIAKLINDRYPPKQGKKLVYYDVAKIIARLKDKINPV